MDEPVKKTGEKRVLPPGPGRPKGIPNKNTTLLKDALIQAAEQAGGKEGLVGYLTTQATANPGHFMTLLGKVLPLQLTGDKENPVEIVNRQAVEYVDEIVGLLQQQAQKATLAVSKDVGEHGPH
ncbi:hypothetical protein UFOVP1204_73 [uncultured Caudovirales phage]|uniref:Uncharacterized protein n=1 Tax=uncultured Caudovirales phage TaxID=2100421 RepID=A0A6J5PZC3_9CAUD|nr:hypothetical protein UFOVP473_28 [uncultured Caudovirales phage]CAB4176472.1 hypothetical protein UFOVP983_28 [uncultured Caudovirales phage]CAB4190469.1 hypothetical protein UFOVP1204_73 [uncultured Caudovirales phage]